jgi:ATP-binding cassette subfamily C protein CydCD
MRLIPTGCWPFVRPARVTLGAVLVLQSLQGLLIVAQAFVVAGGITALVQDEAITGWIRWIVVVALARGAVSFAADSAAASAAATVATGLRTRVLRRLALGSAVPGRTGESALLTVRGVGEIKPYLTRYLPAVVLCILVPPLVLAAMALADPLSGLVVLLTLPLVPVFGALVGLQTRARAERRWRELGSLAGHFVDVMKGLPTLVAFRRADRQVETIRSVTHRYRRASLATLRIAFASSAVLELITTLSVALVAVCVGLRLAAGHMDLGTAMFVLLLAPEAYLPFRRAGAEFHAAATGRQVFENVSALLSPDGQEARDDESRLTPGPGVPDIELVDVRVRWPGSRRDALASTRLTLPRSGLVAVRGVSGAGKSTLLEVIRGRIEPTDGHVAVDGHDLRRVPPEQWREQVGWLPQEPVFVSGTVADNLRLAKTAATDSELWEALARVGLRAKVGALAGGLTAEVEEDGRNFSAGERARLALARVTLAARPILLLDEPSAHVDRETEAVIGEVVAELSRDRLVVVATHSDRLAARAESIVRLRQGETASAYVAEPTSRPEVSRHEDEAAARTDSGDDGHVTRRAVTAYLFGLLASLSGIALTATAGWLIITASSHPPVLTLLVAIVAVRTFGLARPCLRYLERLVSHDVALGRLARIRAEVFAALIPLTPGGLGRRRGDVLDELVEDSEAFVDRPLRVWLPLATTGTAGGLVIVAVALGWPSIAAVDAALVVAAGMAAVLVTWRLERLNVGSGVARRLLSSQTQSFLETKDELVWWNGQDAALESLQRTDRALERRLRREVVAEAAARAGIVVATGAVAALTLALVRTPASSGEIDAAWAGLLVLVPMALGDLLQSWPDVAVQEHRTRHALRHLAGVVARPARVVAPVEPQSLDAWWGDVALRDVSASWTDRAVIEHLDAAWPAAASVGVQGASGSGKSTLAAVVVRYLDPTSGQVWLGGRRLTDAPLDEVRRRLLLLDDRPHLFSTTLGNNLRLADPAASDQQLVEVLHDVDLAAWFAELPDGLDTMVGEGHRQVSGGELTRLALARALLVDPDLLVLDEPTAHLDSVTAAAVMQSVRRHGHGRTLVLLSHRAEDLAACDAHLDLSPQSALRRTEGERPHPAPIR